MIFVDLFHLCLFYVYLYIIRRFYRNHSGNTLNITKCQCSVHFKQLGMVELHIASIPGRLRVLRTIFIYDVIGTLYIVI